jgi:ATP-dependent Lhr-like helicase
MNADIDAHSSQTRGFGEAWIAQLVQEKRAIEIGIGGEMRYAAAEDAARYRDAFGCAIPMGLPMAFTDPVARPLEEIVGRYARTHGPFVTADVAARFEAPTERIAGALAALESEDRIVVGEFRPEGVSREFCDVDVLRQLRRRSLASLRKEVEPVDQEALPIPSGMARDPGKPARYRRTRRVAHRVVGRGARGVDHRVRRASVSHPRISLLDARRAVHRG